MLLLMKKNTEENYSIEAVKELMDYLFLLITIQQVIIKLVLIDTKNTFFQELK